MEDCLNGIVKVRQSLAELVCQAAAKAQSEGKLPSMTLPEVMIERPQNPEHGDYASSYPLKLARATGVNPLSIAKDMVGYMAGCSDLADIAVAPPGFINFTLKKEWLTSQVNAILKAGEKYGDSDIGKGRRVQLEFVSVNPTGPLHVGHGRGAILGSAIANVLTAANHYVEKEYYINDAGTQIENFCRSVYTRYLQQFGVDAAMPTEGYMGSYVVDLAKELIAEHGDKFVKLGEKEALKELGKLGLEKMIARIKEDLDLMRVNFDVWFSEHSLYDKGQYQKVMSLLHEGGYIVDRENATWFVSTALGDDKDNVVVRGDGSPTYFASDIAYHYNKFIERKFDRVINIWGADHQGHVSRMKAVVSALGIDPKRLHIIIYQMVTLRRGQEMVRLSKRSGDIITLREVIEEVGADACRFFFLSRSPDSQMDFDLELAKKQSDENPVYYVQYAHARIDSVLRMAKSKEIDYSKGDVSALSSAAELALVRQMLRLPEIIEIIVHTLEPHHLTYYAQDLATVVHSFYNQCRVITQDECVTAARLKLAEATKIVLAKTLHLMGITAPDKM